MKKKHVIIHAISFICIIALLLVCFIIPKSDKTSVTGNMRSESYVGGIIYQQSAEVAALYKQTFELAKIQLDNRITENGGTGENLAIVTDIDATLIDDSGYFADAIRNQLSDHSYLNSSTWYDGVSPIDNDVE